MSSFEEQELKKLENALAALTPRPAHFDRDGLLFEAGRRSVRPNPLWWYSTLGMSSVAGLLFFALVLQVRSPGRPVTQFVDVNRPPVPIQPAPAEAFVMPPEMPREMPAALPDEDLPLPPSSYWRMQQTALRVGIERLPTTDPAAGDASPRPPTPVPMAGSRSIHSTTLLTGDQ